MTFDGKTDVGKLQDIRNSELPKFGSNLETKESVSFWSKVFESSESVKQFIDETLDGSRALDETSKENCQLSDDEKKRIKEETGWSDEIINAIGSIEEYEIYKNAGLVEAEIGGKPALIRSDIDWGQIDEKGRTNAERAKQGLAPLDKNGDSIQLHHIGQHADSPLAELTFDEHRCGGNDTILHDKSIETETHGEGNTWNSERENYWKNREESLNSIGDRPNE